MGSNVLAGLAVNTYHLRTRERIVVFAEKVMYLHSRSLLYPSTSHTCTCCGCCYNVGTIAIALQRENTPTIDRIKLIREQRKSGGNSLACGGNRGHAVLHQSCSAAHATREYFRQQQQCCCCLLAVFRPPSYVYQLPTCTLDSRFDETPRLVHGTAFSRLVGGCGRHM